MGSPFTHPNVEREARIKSDFLVPKFVEISRKNFAPAATTSHAGTVRSVAASRIAPRNGEQQRTSIYYKQSAPIFVSVDNANYYAQTSPAQRDLPAARINDRC